MKTFYANVQRFVLLLRRHAAMLQVRRLKKFLRWAGIWLSGSPGRDRIHVSYGHESIPQSHEPAHGGMVKFQRMQEVFPNSFRRFNILYMVSSWRPKDWRALLWLARQKHAKLVWNQNGVGYPAWCGDKYTKINAPMARLLHAADYVFYQSHFCKLSADRFLGKRRENYEILYNAVDTTFFTPAESDDEPRHLVLLLGGSQFQAYRVITALRTLAMVAKHRSDVCLLITGKLTWIAGEWAEVQQLLIDLGIAEKVQFLGAYTQQEAPSILRKAHILLHPQYNDACPASVLEAMACGLPVVYSQSGGVPELVGPEAGIGIPAELSWENIIAPDPEALTQAILHIAERRTVFAEAARQRAVEHFELGVWLKRHREVFEQLLGK